MRRVLWIALLVLTLTSVSTATWAAFPGGNGRIAFERESVAGDHTQTDLYSAGRDGTGVRRLTATPNTNELGPAWSAGGGRLAFWRTRAPYGPGSLWVMNADGSAKRRLTTGIDARDPAWNPAGNRLAYDRFGGHDLYTLRVSDGADRQQLTSGPPLDFEPAWSPDGARIAFSRGFATGDVGDVYLLDLTTHRVSRVTLSPAYDHQVAWSPSGRRLVFERDFDHSSSIFTVRPDGTDLQRLTRGGYFDTGPAWAPDGRLIVFGSDRGGGFLDDLWVIHPDGSDLHRLLGLGNASEGFPDWQPVH